MAHIIGDSGEVEVCVEFVHRRSDYLYFHSQSQYATSFRITDIPDGKNFSVVYRGYFDW